MSEEFDREAEKEKLRKQLEEEEEARQATQRMSELLLQGATMTNVHCEECGDPIFRDQGQAFCPTCERPVRVDDGDSAPSDSDAGDSGAATQAESRESSAVSAAGDPTRATDGESQEVGIEARSETSGASSGQVQPETGIQRRDVGGVPGDLGEARGALVRTLTALAHEAETAEDLGRTRSLLQASREAAEAVAAVDSIGR